MANLPAVMGGATDCIRDLLMLTACSGTQERKCPERAGTMPPATDSPSPSTRSADPSDTPDAQVSLKEHAVAAACGSMTIARLLIAILVSCGFAAFQFGGMKLLYLLFIGSWLIPFPVMMIPDCVFTAQFGLLNTVLGIVMPNVCSAFAAIMLRPQVQGIPRELLEASAKGRGKGGTLWHVVIPNLRATLASLSVILFISAWNEYLWAGAGDATENHCDAGGYPRIPCAEGRN